MSYPSGFSRPHIDDRGTYKIAQGEDNVRSGVDEGPSSTFSDFFSRVDTTGVIMWLRPVGEPRADAFGGNFPFLPISRFLFLHRDLVLRTIRKMIEVE